jgi:phage terminase large subunit
MKREREKTNRLLKAAEKKAKALEPPPPRQTVTVPPEFSEPDETPPPKFYAPDFNPAQEGFFKDITPLCLYSGAFGAGKTHILALKAVALSLAYPKNFILLCRKEFASMRQTTIRKFLELAEPYKIDYNKTEQLVTFPAEFGRSQVLFSGLDDPQRIASLEVAWIGIDESIELEESDWIMLSGRLRHKAMPFRQMAGASNPCIPGSYQHKMFFDRGEGNIYHSTALDNTHNPPDFAERLGMFKGIYYDRYVLGKCVGAEGLVYDCYDPAVHVIDPFQIPEDWPRYRGIDFGYAEAFVCLWAARQPHEPTEHFPYPKDSIFVYREIYRRHELVENHARAIRARSQTVREGEKFAERIACTFADHDAEGRATLNAYGVGTIRATKDVAPGIQAVYRRLSMRPPTLYFFRDLQKGLDRDPSLVSAGLSTGVLEEFGSYSWEPAGEGRSAKEAPRKKGDHAMDALRYLVMGIERGQERPVVFL